MGSSLKVAACQMPDIQNDSEKSLSTMIDFAARAESLGADLVCFPECYLQGYIVNDTETRQLGLDLFSDEFRRILDRLAKLKPILVFGLIELQGQKLFNTAVVVKQGKLFGQYRKAKLLPGESVFDAGTEFPVFDLVKGFSFGINICYDLNFSECAAALAKQKAQLLVCPSNNMMRYETAEKWKHKHNESRCLRASESGLWILSSDVTGDRDGRVSYGPTALINPQGEVVAQVPLSQEGIIVQELVFN